MVSRPARDLKVVATLATPPSAAASALAALPRSVHCLEVRADITGDLDPGWLRARFGGELLYTLRSRRQGGRFYGSPAERHRRLLQAAERYDLVDLEADGDLEPGLLQRVPWRRRVVSWHGGPAGAGELRWRFERMATAARARLYRLVPAAAAVEQALAPLGLLRELGRRDVTAFAAGPAATWSRLLAPYLGAPLVFGLAAPGGGTDPSDNGTAGPGDGADASGALSVEDLAGDYGLPGGPRPSELYGIVGSPRSVGRSLSPRLHNAGYRALGLPGLFLPFPVEDFPRFWRRVVEQGLPALGLPLRGLTVTAPHKETALAAAGAASPLARRAGAANLLLRRDGDGPGATGGWWAATTDAVGAVGALATTGVAIPGRKAAVIGCGGAGRAAAAGLRRAGAKVTLVNRNPERGRYAARLLGLDFLPLAEFSPEAFSLVVHATPLTEPPFRVGSLGRRAVVLDLVYGAAPTLLAAAARASGRTVVDGWEVLLVEVRRQFRLMTGRRLPRRLARALLGGGVAAGSGDGDGMQVELMEV